MAKKNKKRKSTGRRRRVSGIDSMPLQAIGLGILGAIGASKLSTELKKKTGTAAEIAPYAGLGAGLALLMFVKNPMVKQLALGMAISGGIETTKKLAPNLIGSPYNLPVIAGPQRRRVSGGVMTPNAVGGYSPARSSVYGDNLSVISGVKSPAATMAAAGM